MKVGKEWKMYLLLSFLLLCIVYVGFANYKNNDYYIKSIPFYEYQEGEEAAVIDEKSKACKLWNRMPGTLSSVATLPFALEKGEYALTITYQSSSDKNVVKLESEFAVNSRNEKGISLISAVLSPESNEITIPITTDRLYLDAVIQYECGAGELSILDTTVKSTSPHFSDALFLTFALILCLLVLFVNTAYKRRRKDGTEGTTFPIAIILMAAIVVATLPYFNDFLIKGHDLPIHLARIEGIYYAILNGEFPARINPIQLYGYGYAMPIMYPDFFLYIPAFLRLCGVSLLLSYKCFIFLLNVATVMISYQCFKRLLRSEYAGVIGSVLYTLGSYRLSNIFERAALGEIIAMTFFPLVIWSMYEILKGNSRKWLGAAIGYACIFMAHMLTTVMVLFFTVIAVAAAYQKLWKEKERLVHLLCAAGSAVLMVAWCAIPLLSYLRLPFNIGDTMDPLHASSVYFSQIYSGEWGAGFRGNVALGNTTGEMPLTLGIVLILGLLLFFIGYRTNKEKKTYQLGMIFFVLGGIALFMASWLFPWEALQKLEWLGRIVSKFQFAFRFLIIVSAFWTITATIGIMDFLKEKISDKAVILTVLLLFAVSFAYLDGTLEKDTYPNKNAMIAVNDNDNLYMYQNINPYHWFLNGESIIVSPDAAVQISDYVKKGTKIKFNAFIENTSADSYFDLPLAYYPGYVAKWEGEELQVMMSDLGMVRFQMPPASGAITVEYKEKPLWVVGNMISLLTWVGVIGMAIKKKTGVCPPTVL